MLCCVTQGDCPAVSLVSCVWGTVPLCLWFQDIANSGAFLSLELS